MESRAMARSLLVVFPIAETTTTGRRSIRALTIEATRSMAAADSTDVPPNFITIIAIPLRASVEQSFADHQFCVEHGSSGGAPNRVMPHGDELEVEHRARPQPPDKDGHPAFALDVLAGLWTVTLQHVDHGHGRRAGQMALLRDARVGSERLH